MQLRNTLLFIIKGCIFKTFLACLLLVLNCVNSVNCAEREDFFIFDKNNPEISEWGKVNSKVKNFLSLNEKAWQKKDISILISLRGYLEDSPEYLPYNSGLELSILSLAESLKQQYLVNKQINKLLKMPNTRYVSSFSENSWGWGWTHPAVVFFSQLPKSQTKEEYLKILIGLIKKYDDKYWFGTVQTSNQRSYAELFIEELYYNSFFQKKKFTTEDKLLYINQMLPYLSNGALGNAQYCLSLIYKELGEENKSLEYKKNCFDSYTKAYKEDPHAHFFSQMIDLCTIKTMDNNDETAAPVEESPATEEVKTEEVKTEEVDYFSLCANGNVIACAKVCNDGNAVGCLFLGFSYHEGKGIKQDYLKALELFKKACNDESAEGCYDLGVLYQSGKGVNQDYLKAKEFYGKACDLKNQSGCEAYAKLNK